MKMKMKMKYFISERGNFGLQIADLRQLIMIIKQNKQNNLVILQRKQSKVGNQGSNPLFTN